MEATPWTGRQTSWWQTKEISMATTVKVADGRVTEYANGSRIRSYGSHIVDADTDGDVVAAVTAQGRVEEYRNGSRLRSYGSNVVRVQVSGGVVAATLSNGRIEEYRNGSRLRSY
jgi:hypothetical protein